MIYVKPSLTFKIDIKLSVFLNVNAFLHSITITGWRRPLKNSDLWPLNDHETSTALIPLWEKHWNVAMEQYLQKKEKLQSEQQHSTLNGHLKEDEEHVKMMGQNKPKMPSKPSIAFALFKCFKSVMIPAVIFKTCADLVQFVNPQILRYDVQL